MPRTPSNRPTRSASSKNAPGALQKPPASLGKLTGAVSVNPRGFGFVTSADPTQPDLFIPPALLRTSRLIDADVVEATYTSDSIRAQAISLKLLERPRTRVFGVLTGRTLAPDPYMANHPINVLGSPQDEPLAVVVEISKDHNARVISKIGAVNSLEATYARAIERTRLGELLDSLDEPAPSHSGPSRALSSPPRRDLTGLLTFTIDGPESQDLDDAISTARDPDGSYRLFVHISDVASVVELDSPEDIRARTLGTSTYLPGYSIPMFDPSISYDRCSLLAQRPRACLTVEMVFSRNGALRQSLIYESTIVSDHRLTYTQVSDFLREKISLDTPLASALRDTLDLTSKLKTQRLARGGLSGPDITLLDELGVTDNLAGFSPNDGAQVAHDLIEEAMVTANETVAAWLKANSLLGLYRAHHAPNPPAALALSSLAGFYGLAARLTDPLGPLELAQFEESFISAGLDPDVIFGVLADYQERAYYTPSPEAHFGLASTAYVHFTSPIRRYADLTIHRIIKQHINYERTRTPTLAFFDLPYLTNLADQINTASSRASRTEAVARALLSAQILSRHPKRIHDARFARFTPRGAQVRLTKSGATGCILKSTLLRPSSGLYEIHPLGLALTTSNHRFVLGDKLKVRLTDVDLAEPSLAFEIL